MAASTTTTEIKCKACSKTPLSDGPTFLVCSRCQSLTSGTRKTYYCSKTCQSLDWTLHKPTICGQPLPAPSSSTPASSQTPSLDPSLIDTSSLSPALLFHLAALKTLSLPSSSFSSSKLHPTPSYLYFPTSPLSPSSSSLSNPIPIHLPPTSHKLFTCLFLRALRPPTSPLSVTLMYSLLITSIAALQGGEERLISQLTEEFPGVDVRGLIEGDSEPGEDELRDSIGGEENLGLLLEWQMEEAERMREAGVA
ncbi:hypothetical protein JCM5353_001655 [Sporobolomyces roseus]